MSLGSALIATEFTSRAKAAEKVADVVNHTFRPLLEARNLDPREYVPLQELDSESDHPNDVAVVDWRRSDAHGPIGARIPRRSPYLVLRRVQETGYLSVHHELRQVARVSPQLQ